MIDGIVRAQYINKIQQLDRLKGLLRPKEGWIRTLRKALGMSGPQLAVRLGVSKSQTSQMERMEMEDRITIKQLRRVADVLDCDLVYALVPRKEVNEAVYEQAWQKAEQLVRKVDVQMKLEAQQLSSEKLQEQIRMEAERLVREMPRDLWDRPK